MVYGATSGEGTYILSVGLPTKVSRLLMYESRRCLTYVNCAFPAHLAYDLFSRGARYKSEDSTASAMCGICH